MKVKKQYLAKRLSLFNIDLVGETIGGVDTLHSAILDTICENVENGIDPKIYITNNEKMRQGTILIDADLPYNEQVIFDVLHNDIGSKIYRSSFFNEISEDQAWFIYKNLLLAGMNTMIFIQVGNFNNEESSTNGLELGRKIEELGILPTMRYDIIKDFWQDYKGKVIEVIKKVAEFEKQMYLIKKLHPQNIAGLYLGNAFGMLMDKPYDFDFVVETGLNPINSPIDFSEYIHILQIHPELKGDAKILIVRKGNPISEYLIHYNKAMKRINRNTVTLSI